MTWPTPGAREGADGALPEVPTLITRCLDGDQAAFGRLYREHRDLVARLVYRVLGPTSEIDDVIQEVFLQVHRSLTRFRGQSQFTTWLHRVTINVALQQIRKRRSQPVAYVTDPVEMPEAPTETTPLDEAMTHERLLAVYRVLDTLSPKKRAVLVLHDLESLPTTEVAAIVGANVLTVRTRLFYARREFYGKLSKEPAFVGVEMAA